MGRLLADPFFKEEGIIMAYGNDAEQFCPHINDKGITSNLVATNALQKRHIKAGAVTNSKIATGTISLGSFKDLGSVGKINAKYVTCTFTATTLTTVTHGLGRAPQGYLVVGKTKEADVYNATTNWASALATTVLRLRTGATCAVRLLVW